MAVPVHNYTTGPTSVPTIGKVDYNGCTFGPLFVTTLSGVAVKDDAQRTVKYMEYNLHVDGYVTLPESMTDFTIAPVMNTLRDLLSKQGGALVYEGRGCDLHINTAAGTKDVAWGPVPEILEFQPLGAGRSAKIVWECKIRIPEQKARAGKIAGGFGGGIASIPLLQFCYETSLTYGEDGFSTITVQGVAEIPLTRSPSQATRTVAQTADEVRKIVETRLIAPGINLANYRITRREFNVSKDKRLLNWTFVAEEKPYMDLPPGCTIARGSYNVRQAQSGIGLCNWLCTLRATYTVRADMPRRVAWNAFLALLRLRMKEANYPNSNIPGVSTPSQLAQNAAAATRTAFRISRFFWNATNAGAVTQTVTNLMTLYRTLVVGIETTEEMVGGNKKQPNRAILVDFNIDEGLYADSKNVTFSASWRIITTFSHILLASGLWKKVDEETPTGENLWAMSMKDIQGSESWHANKLNPALDLIVDFGA
jgi:hypothetical protein